jgi:tripeptide aminopeptidase
MYEAIKKQPQVMAAVVESARKLGIPLVERIIRGGTDGARLAELGVPAPNLFTGGHNYHSRYEWAALDAMVDAARLVEHIILHWAGATC